MGRLILIADDNELIRRKLCSLLESEGFEVCNASNGAEAISVAEECSPDLIILDLAMPIINGLEAARMLTRKMPFVPLVMFTNSVGTVLERQALSAGIAAVYSKAASATLLVEGVKARLA